MIRFRPAQLALVFVASLAAAASAAEMKVGVVTLERLMQESPQGKAVSDALKEEFGSRQRALEAKRKDLQAREEKLNRDRSVMSDQERVDSEEQLRTGQQRFQREASEYEDDVNAARNKLLGNLQRTIVREVQAQAKEGGYDLVVGAGVLWASPSADMTGAVLKRLEALAATGPKAATAPPKAPADPAKTPPKK